MLDDSLGPCGRFRMDPDLLARTQPRVARLLRALRRRTLPRGAAPAPPRAHARCLRLEPRTGALAKQRGYLGTRLYRSVAAADFRFVDTTRWSSPLMVARATRLDAVQEAIDALPFRSHPALYLAVSD